MKSNDELSKSQKCIGAIVATLLISSSFFILYFPPVKLTVETDRRGVTTKFVKEDIDSSTAFLALFVSGITVLSYALNGLRFSKISAAGVTAEAIKAGEAAQAFYDIPTEVREEEVVLVTDKESPEPKDSPVSYRDLPDGRYAIYTLETIPASVISDALAHWPEKERPDDLGFFEFATHKLGKGNNPWTIKFKGKSAVKVSYGGQGKTHPTVASTE